MVSVVVVIFDFAKELFHKRCELLSHWCKFLSHVVDEWTPLFWTRAKSTSSSRRTLTPSTAPSTGTSTSPTSRTSSAPATSATSAPSTKARESPALLLLSEVMSLRCSPPVLLLLLRFLVDLSLNKLGCLTGVLNLDERMLLMNILGFTFLTKVIVAAHWALVTNTDNRVHLTPITHKVLMDWISGWCRCFV